jgi:hypothetical protein
MQTAGIDMADKKKTNLFHRNENTFVGPPSSAGK